MSANISSKQAQMFSPSQLSMFIKMTTQWINEHHSNINPTNNKENIENKENKESIQATNNKQNLSANQSKQQQQRSQLSQTLTQMKEHNHRLKNNDFENAKLDFMEAIGWRKYEKKFKKYIEFSYDKCRNAKLSIKASYDKLFMYSLLISSGFIYYSDFGNNFINGLRQIYYILIDMNNDIQLRKDLDTALKKKMFWNDSEKKLINASIQFAVRTHNLIQMLLNDNEIINQHKNSMSGSDIENKYDEKEPELTKYISSGDEKYWNMEWLPVYYDGYYFGKVTEKPYKFAALSLKKFRKIMSAEKVPYRVHIDELIIHTDSLPESGVYIKKHSEQKHHWFNATDWIDFSIENEFNIAAHIINNGKFHGLTVNLYDTVKMIKNEIATKEGNVSPAMLRIDWNGKRLQDDATIYEYNIRKGCQLRVTLVSFNPFLNLVSK